MLQPPGSLISLERRICLLGLFLLGALFSAGSLRAFPAGQQTYHLLGYDESLTNIWRMIDRAEFGGGFLNNLKAPNPPGQPSQSSSIITITVPIGGQVIIFDHGEDGLEADYAAIPAANIRNVSGGGTGTTEIWGDGDPNNGIPPNDPNGDDILDDQQVIELESSPTTNFAGYAAPCANNRCSPININPRVLSEIRYDGLDVIYTVGQPISVVQVNYPAQANAALTVIGGSWEIFPLEAYQENFTYTIPVGEDSYTNNGQDDGPFENFKYCYAVVHATEDDTAVVIENGDPAPVVFVLNQGETWTSTSLTGTGCGGPGSNPCGAIDSNENATPGVVIRQNTRITASKPVQCGLVTAGDGSFQTRMYNVLPTGLYASEYLSPVFSGAGTEMTADMFINNPNDVAITVTAQTLTGTTTINVPANSAASYANANGGNYVSSGSSLRLTSTELFWGIGAYSSGGDAGGPPAVTGLDGTGGDWGWALQASGFIQEEVVCAHGPGNVGLVNGSGSTGDNGSPVWVGFAENNTTVSADWDRDGTPDPSDIDNDGTADGTFFTRDALQTLTMYDPSDDNQGGGVIQANAPFSASWGYHNSGASNDTGSVDNVDWGYSVNPRDPRLLEPVIDMQKSVLPSSIAPGGIVTYTLVMSTGRLGPVTNQDVIDFLPPNFSYVDDSAVITYPDLSTVQVDPAITGTLGGGFTLTWDISQTMQTNQEMRVTFQAQSQHGGGGTDVTEDWQTPGTPANPGSYQNGTGWTGNWTEQGEGTNATGGQIQVRGNTGAPSCQNTNHLEFRGGDNMSVTRQVDLSSFTSPELRFDHRHRLSAPPGENYQVQVSTNGSTFSTVLTVNTAGGGGSCTSEAIDLSSFISATTYIRFRGTGGLETGTPGAGATDDWEIDDIVITDTAATPTLATNRAEVVASYNGFTLKATDQADVYFNDLALTKSVSLAQAEVGDVLTYTLSFQNNGTSSIPNVTIEDGVPPFTQVVPGSLTTASPFGAGSYDGLSKSVSWGPATLGPGASGTVTYQVVVSRVPFDRTKVKNIATILVGGTRTIDSNEVLTEIRTPIFELLKTAPGSVAPGEILTYTFEFRNSGQVGATGVVVTDRIPFAEVGGTPTRTAYVLGTATPTATFSNNNGTSFTYSPTDSGDGTDPNVTHLRYPSTSIPAAGAVTGTFQVKVPAGADVGETIRNFAFLTNDQTPIKVTTFAETLVANLRIGLATDPVACPRKSMKFTLTPEALAGSNFSNVVVHQEIPTYSVYQNGSATAPPGWTVEYSTNGGSSYTTVEPPDGSLVTDLQFTVASFPGGGGGGPTVIASETWQTPGTPADPASYQNGSGWTGNWIEQGEGTNATGGNVRVRTNGTGTSCNGNALEIRRGTNGTVVRSIYREIDLTGETGNDLELAYDYWTQGLGGGGENMFVRIAENAGFTTNVTTLATYNGGQNCTGDTHDISAYAGTTAFLGIFGDTSNSSGNDRIRVDDITITSTPPAVGASPTTTKLSFKVIPDQFIPGSTSLQAVAEIESTQTAAIDPISSNLLTIPVVNVRVTKSADKIAAAPGETITWTVTAQNIGTAAATSAVLEEPGVGGYTIFSQTTPVTPIPNSGTFASGKVTWSLGTLIPFATPITRTFQSTVNLGATTGTQITNIALVRDAICVSFSNTADVLVAGIGVTVGPDSTSYGDQGDTLTYPVSVTNTGATTDNYDLTLSPSDADWDPGMFHTVYLDVDGDGEYDPAIDIEMVDGDNDGNPDNPTPNIPPGGTIHLLVVVTIPPDGTGAGDNTAPDGETNVTTLTATSTSNGTIQDSADLTTVVLSATSIQLMHMAAVDTPLGVRVTWKTQGEMQNRGFLLTRGPSPSGPWEEAHCCLIPGMGTFFGARDYEVYDTKAPGQGPLYYQLTDLDFLGRTRRHPPVAIDRDGDGIDFADEARLGLSDEDASDGAADPDQDGVSTAEEVASGRDPFGEDALDSVKASVEVVQRTRPPEGVRILRQAPGEMDLELTLWAFDRREKILDGQTYSYPVLGLAAGTVGEEGEPMLPVVGFHVPPGLTQVEVLEVQQETHEGVLVGPTPRAEETRAKSNLMPLYQFQPEVYEALPNLYPPEVVRVEPGIYQGRLVFHPFAYDHSAQRLTFRKRIQVRLRGRPQSLVQGIRIEADPGLSSLPEGETYLLRTEGEGLYRISAQDLIDEGVPVDSLVVENLALFRGGERLPMYLEGEDDGSFDLGDALVFYQADSGDRYSTGDGLFLVHTSSEQPRWESFQPQVGAPLEPLAFYLHETKQAFRNYYFATIPGDESKDRFVAELFDLGTFSFRHPTAGSQFFPARVDFPVELFDPYREGVDGEIDFLYATSQDFRGDPDHHHRLLVDGQAVGEDTWSGEGFHRARASFPSHLLRSGEVGIGLEARLEKLPDSVTTDQFLPSELTVRYPRKLEVLDDKVRYVAQAGAFRAVFQGFSGSRVYVLDVSDPNQPKSWAAVQVQAGAGSSSQVTIDHDSEAAHELLLVGPDAVLDGSAVTIRPVDRSGPSLRDPETRAGWVAIVPDSTWVDALAPLVQLRQQEGLEPKVLTMDSIAQEFSSGVSHPLGIRRLVEFALANWERAPEYLVLASDTHVNPRLYPGVFGTTAPIRVPTHFTVVGGREYRAETGDDGYFVRRALGSVPDLAVGRLPARSAQELAGMANKIVSYQASSGPWQRRVLSVADDGEPLFAELAEGKIDSILPGLEVQRYHQGDTATFPNLASFQSEFDSALQAGSLLLQFVGHASFDEWTEDEILTDQKAQALTNAGQLPFVLSMTCYDNHFTIIPEHQLEGLGETLMRNPSGGVIAFYGSGVQSTILAKDLLHRSVMTALFDQDQRRVGDAVRAGLDHYLANSSDTEKLAAAFNLMGDPATLLQIPNPRQPSSLAIRVNSDQTLEVSWQAVQDPAATHYEVYVRQGDGTQALLGTTAETRFEDRFPDSAPEGSIRYYTVRAVAADGLASALPREVQAIKQGVVGGGSDGSGSGTGSSSGGGTGGTGGTTTGGGTGSSGGSDPVDDNNERVRALAGCMAQGSPGTLGLPLVAFPWIWLLLARLGFPSRRQSSGIARGGR